MQKKGDIMKPIVTCREMKALDTNTIENMGVPSLVLMERASLKVVEEMEKFLKSEERILVVCGSGNNGGDGIAAARILFLKGYRCEIFLAGKTESMTKETKAQWEIAGNYHVPFTNNPDWDEYTTIVDAIFGVGLSRPIEGRYGEIIHEMNKAHARKVAVDIPSGINGDTGEVLGCAFGADLTVTFAFLKRGLLFFPGRMYAGKTVVADIGIYESVEVPAEAQYVETKDLNLLPGRVPYGNKGTFGKVLFVTGSSTMCGASYLSAYAALRAGAGMVKIQTVEENRQPLLTMLPEAMVTCAFDDEENRKNLDWCDVLVIGPGLGTSPQSRERAYYFLSCAKEAGKPVILDADGLNLLAKYPKWRGLLNENVVVTPHLGEMSRLCEKPVSEIKKNMVQTALDFARETHTVCVLKDACTVVADAKGRLYLNNSGNAGLATAGSGDVLSGILAAVFCRYLAVQDPPDNGKKAALGVFLHGRCADLYADKNGQLGMTATDVIGALPMVLNHMD